MSVQSRVSNPFNPKAAILYGQFVKAAYSMYDPATLTPPPSADFPAGYQLTAWVTMRDFILGSTDPVFYGLIAQSMTDATQFVLAIRGTSNGVEWWDDFNAAIKTPFKVPGCGSVGAGFARIYETLEVIERPTGAATAPAVARSLKPIGGFCPTSCGVGETPRGGDTGDPRFHSYKHAATLQFLRQRAAVTVLLARFGYLPEPDRPDAAARSGLSLVGGACRSTRGSRSRGSRAYGCDARHNQFIRSDRPGDWRTK